MSTPLIRANCSINTLAYYLLGNKGLTLTLKHITSLSRYAMNNKSIVKSKEKVT